MKHVILEIKKERENRQSENFKKNGVFFAFSDKQFEENKTALKEGDKYVSLGAGGYIPKSNVENFLHETEMITKWFNSEVNKTKQTRIKHIEYELYNHEAFYTHDITSTLYALGNDYTEKEVIKVFKNILKKEKV